MSGKVRRLPPLPGISCYPDEKDSVEDTYPDGLQWQIEAEFVDFLITTKDLLDLMHLIKDKYLKSSFPIPHAVLRELKALQGKGNRVREYEQQLKRSSVSASASVENVLFPSSRCKEFGAALKASKSFRPRIYAKGNNDDRRLTDPFLSQLTSKRQKPLWHQVLVDTPITISEKKRRSTLRKTTIDSIGRIEFTAARSFRMNHITTDRNAPMTEETRRQVAEMEASEAGFSTAEDYNTHLLTADADWFTHLCRDAAKVKVVRSAEVSEAFSSLGSYSEMTCRSLPFAKAKLCLIVLSLPIWDACRLGAQRAMLFIMDKILLVPRAPLTLRVWLNSRQLPFVVIPPIPPIPAKTPDGNVSHSMINSATNCGPKMSISEKKNERSKSVIGKEEEDGVI